MMMRYIALCVLLLFPFGLLAEQPMPPMPLGMTMALHGQCNDHDSGQDGYCVFYHDPADNNDWLVFMQENQVMFIRHIFADGKPYEQVWTADRFNSY